MKKNSVIILLFFLGIVSCSTNPKADMNSGQNEKPLPERMVFFSSGLKPNWIKDTEKIGTFQAKQVAYFIVIGEDKTLELATKKAEEQKEKRGNEAFIRLAKKQVEEGIQLLEKENIKIPDSSLKNVLFSTYDHYKLAKEEIQSFKKATFWWEHYSDPKIEKEQVSGWSVPSIKFYQRWVILLTDYEKIRNKILTQIKDKESKESQLQQYIPQLIKKMNDMDQPVYEED